MATLAADFRHLVIQGSMLAPLVGGAIIDCSLKSTRPALHRTTR
jgi:hypothetical protein